LLPKINKVITSLPDCQLVFQPLAPSAQVYTFDEAHPALADQHYLRSPEQNKMLERERTAMAAEQEKATK